MANIKFARGSIIPTVGTTGFDDGCIYFNTSYKNIYLRNSTSVTEFKGTDENVVVYDTADTGDSTFYIGGTPEIGSTGCLYTTSSTYIQDGYLYSGGHLVAPIRSKTVTGTYVLTGQESVTDNVTVLSSNYGVVLAVYPEQVGATTEDYYYKGGTPTVTPGGGNYGPSYKIECAWAKYAGTGTTGTLYGRSPLYTMYYIPRNYNNA